jgi:hypothetical protein
VRVSPRELFAYLAIATVMFWLVVAVYYFNGAVHGVLVVVLLLAALALVTSRP